MRTVQRNSSNEARRAAFFALPAALAFLPLFVGAEAAAQGREGKVTLSGYVRDAETGEELIGVTVLVPATGQGMITNAYGFYSLTLPKGEHVVRYSYVGYRTAEETYDLQADAEANVELETAATQMEEVVVTAERDAVENVSSVSMSRNEIDIELVKKAPALFGEPDLIKAVQMQPGVITAGEGTSAFFVRGGSADQNLILIDEAPVYDPSHFFGLFSVFNSAVIKDSELYKGGIPARFGGRLSSILDVRTKDGNSKEYAGSASIGLMAAKASVEGPIAKDKASFIVAGRRSYADLFFPLFPDLDNGTSVYFYDVNAKVNFKPTNKDRFFLSGYFGRDVLQFNTLAGFDWGNSTGTFRWNHLFNDRFFSNTTLIYSKFDYKLGVDDPTQGFDWTAGQQEVSFKEDMAYFFSPGFELDFGYHFTYRAFQPGKIEPTGNQSIFTTVQLEENYALDHAFYLGAEQQISERLTLQYGLRWSIFQNVGKTEWDWGSFGFHDGETTVYEYADVEDNVDIVRTGEESYGAMEDIVTFHNLEPRFAARYLINESSSVKASYNRMAQNVHLVSNSTVPVPFNTWAPSSPYLDPQLSDQVALGYFRDFKGGAFEASAEIYYKQMNDVTDFADNAELFFNEDIATEYRQGQADSYGLELYARKVKGRLTGFASYTWSRTEYEIDGVNEGNAFPANYDRRHNFNVMASYDLNDQWSFGGSFTYTTGRPITLPNGRYDLFENYSVPQYSERNAYRLPDYHRFDLSATYNPKKNANRKVKSEWAFSIYNVYNRQNPFTIFTRSQTDDDGDVVYDANGNVEQEAVMIYLFPILPSVTYTLKF